MAKVTINHSVGIQNYFNCDIATGTKLDIGESVTIHLECKPYYGTDNTPYIQYTSYGESYGEPIEFTAIDSTHWILTTSFSDYGTSINRSVLISGTADLRYCIIDTSNLVNCESDVEGNCLTSESLTITLTASNNYEFPVQPYLYYQIGTTEYSAVFDKAEDNIYFLTKSLNAGVTYYIIGEAAHKTIVSNKYGLITAYRLSREELQQIASKRWIERSVNPIEWNGQQVLFLGNDQYIDTAKYIVGLFKVFMNIDRDYIIQYKEKLYFGPYDMDMECDVLDTDLINLDFGSVAITGTNNNSIDYDHTTIEAYLPFVGFVTLNTTDYMDRTIGLKYQINIINGEALAILSADGYPMNTYSCSVAFQIPYQMGGNEYVSTSVTPNTNYIENTEPCIYIKSGVATMPDESIPYNTTKYYACFGDLSGYTEATEIDFVVLSSHITKTEIDEIIRLIENGVWF